MFDIHKLVKVTECNFCHLHRSMVNVKFYKCLPHIFAIAFTISEMIKFYIIDLQKVRQSRGVQFCQLHHLIANVKIYNCLSHISAIAKTVSDKNKKVPPKIGHGHGVQFSQFGGKCQIYKRHFFIYFIFAKV